MCAGADCIDDVDVLRSRRHENAVRRGLRTLHARNRCCGSSPSVTPANWIRCSREHLVGLCSRVDLLPGADQQAFIDIDSLLRPVYGHDKQGASYGHTKIAGKQILRKGLSPLATTISTEHGAPVIAGMRLRAGKAGSGKGPRDGRPGDRHRPRGRSARRGPGARRFGLRQPRCRATPASKHGAQFSLVMTKNPPVAAAIASISEHAWIPVHYPGAVLDPDTGRGSPTPKSPKSTYTAFASTKHPVTARLIVRRVNDARYPDELFPVWRYHPFFTNTTDPTAAGRHHPPPARDHRDRVRRSHRRPTVAHALGPLRRQQRVGDLRRDAPQPAACRRHPGRRSACRRPRRDAASPPRHRPGPTRPPQRRPILHLPGHWPWAKAWLTLWHNTIGPARHCPKV